MRSDNLKQMESQKKNASLELEQQKSQRREFVLSRFTTSLQCASSRRARMLKQQAFDAVSYYSQHLQYTESKLAKASQFTTKTKFLRTWLALTRKQRASREEAEYFKAQQQLKVISDKADTFREFKLIVHVMRALKLFAKQVAEERELEREHEQRKNQIDQFFTNLKSKVSSENHLKQTELEKRQLKDKVREQVL